ncbi:MAG: HAD hydrolase family protein, partial [Pseudomonadota bacterium]
GERIELMMVDIDGCITLGEGHPADLDVIRKLAEFNRVAAEDPSVPAVTLCTGRQQPYVELMCQLIGARRPAVFENGSGIYVPETFEFITHPLITPDRLPELVELTISIGRELIKTGKAKLQPGKYLSLSVYPTPESSVEYLGKYLSEMCRERGYDFEIDISIYCVNLFFKGINKGEGVKLIAEREGINLKMIGGVGDGPGDLSYLGIVGFSATPANGHASLKERVDYVATKENGAGTVEIIEECIRRNRP